MLKIIFILALVIFACSNRHYEDSVEQTELISIFKDRWNGYRYAFKSSNIDSLKHYVELIGEIMLDLDSSSISIDARDKIASAANSFLSSRQLFENNCNIPTSKAIDKFSSRNSSLVKDLLFIDQVLNCIYWKSWTCSTDYPLSIGLSADTILLLENTTYSLPIFTTPLSALKIVSNSLQNTEPDKVGIHTPAYTTAPIFIPFDVELLNTITGESIVLRDTVNIVLVKKEG